MKPVQGKGCVKSGPHDLGMVRYTVEVGAGGQASLVQFEQPPSVNDGETLHLTLEDGRMLDCQVIDSSSYCAVVGEGPYLDRRRSDR